MDGGKWGNLRYYIVGGNGDKTWKIDDKTGQITVDTENVDFERKALHDVTVRVVDTQGAGLIQEATVTITLSDINDPPAVEDAAETDARTVFENSKPGTLVGIAVAASDQDARDTLRYTLTGANCWQAQVAQGSKSGEVNYFAPALTRAANGAAAVRLSVKASKDVVVDLASGSGGSDGVDASERYSVVLNQGGTPGVSVTRFAKGNAHTIPCAGAATADFFAPGHERMERH